MGEGKENSGSKAAFETVVGFAQIIGTVIGIIALIVALLGLVWAIKYPNIAIQVVRVISGEPTAASIPPTNTLPPPTDVPIATPTPVSTTILLPTSTPTDTPSPTVTPIPTDTPTPTPPPSPIPVSGLPILFQEDFSDPQGGWEYGSGCYGLSSPGYKNGEMVLNAGSCIKFAEARPHLSFDNFILEFDSRWSGGAVGGIYGVRFRFQDFLNFYQFYIANDGRYTISKQANHGESLVLLEGFSDSIDRTGGINRFHLEANEHDLRFFINGQFLGETHDTEHDLGEIILIANTSYGTFETSFDNVIVARHP